MARRISRSKGSLCQGSGLGALRLEMESTQRRGRPRGLLRFVNVSELEVSSSWGWRTVRVTRHKSLRWRFKHAPPVPPRAVSLAAPALQFPRGWPAVGTATQPATSPPLERNFTSSNQRRNEDVWRWNDLYLIGSFT